MGWSWYQTLLLGCPAADVFTFLFLGSFHITIKPKTYRLFQGVTEQPSIYGGPHTEAKTSGP